MNNVQVFPYVQCTSVPLCTRVKAYSICGMMEGGGEWFSQARGQVRDETHGVGVQHKQLVGQASGMYGNIQRSKQPVLWLQGLVASQCLD